MSDELLTLVEERQAQAAIRDEADRRVRALSDQIGVALITADTPKITLGDWSVSVGQQTRESLSKDLLLEHGVSTDQIRAATKTTASTMVTVRRLARKP